MEKSLPYATVICLCYQHAPFVRECLESVFAQDYPKVQVIVVDDGSADSSVAEIRKILQENGEKDVLFIPLEENLGNCKAFNIGLENAHGKYIIDLATDDVLEPHRISRQVEVFEALPQDYAVVFSDVLFIDENSRPIRTHYQRDRSGNLLDEVPTGYVYSQLLRNAFISTPSMMMRKSVLEELEGYDESLSYEDFDFWVRSGRNYRYHFSDEILTRKRVVAGSHSKSFYKKRNNRHLDSTLKVCYKALAQNRNQEENEALAHCVAYHFKLSVLTENFPLAREYFLLLRKLPYSTSLSDWLLLRAASWKLPVHYFYRLYLKIKNPVS